MSDDKGLDVNALGQATNTSFGRSSTMSSATFSVKVRQITDDRLRVDYIVIVTYAEGNSLRDLTQKYASEAQSAINETLKKVKAEYKELSGKTLKAKQLGDPSSALEPVSLSAFSQVRRAYFKYNVVYEIS